MNSTDKFIECWAKKEKEVRKKHKLLKKAFKEARKKHELLTKEFKEGRNTDKPDTVLVKRPAEYVLNNVI